MSVEFGLERCLTFIHCQLHPANAVMPGSTAAKRCRAVTLSRQTGTGAHAVAEKLAVYLQGHEKTGERPWTVFDRNLVEAVLEDHHLPPSLARYMPEDRVSQIEDGLEELFGLHPPSWTLVDKTAETILRLADAGNVILIGRGAGIITSRLDYVLHARLIGSLEKRAERVVKDRQIGKKEALEIIRAEDSGRRRYLKKYFGRDIDDSSLYHLVINTDFITPDEAARIIGEVVVSRQPIHVAPA